MAATHQFLTSAEFDKLADGGGGPAAIEALRSVQLGKHLVFVKYVLESWPGAAGNRDGIVDALDRARAQGPTEFAEVLGAPLVGAWSAIAARAASHGEACWADYAHLGAIAMVACAAAGIDGSADVPVRDGMVTVPGHGAAIVASKDTAQLITADGRLTVRAGKTIIQVPQQSATASSQWLPVRLLAGEASGQRIDLSLDDIDPYRHGHHAPPAARLSSAEVDRWRGLFADAWQLLAAQLPQRAAELATGLRTLVPLQQTDAAISRSATIRHAFAVFGLTRPLSPVEFAVTLVHEFQHSKLSAILDLAPLSDPADNRRYFAPWRIDPRPLAGLLQGVYAFVGVADTWRALRSVDRLAQSAEQHFAEARLQVDRGLAAVEESGALTAVGEALVARLRRKTDEMLAVPVPEATARAAQRKLEQTRAKWLERNGSASRDG